MKGAIEEVLETAEKLRRACKGRIRDQKSSRNQ